MKSDEPKTTPKPPWRKAADRILEMGIRIYTSRAERAAMRGGMGGAAVLFDAIARAQSSKELEAVAKLCGDEIWKMRNRVHVPHV